MFIQLTTQNDTNPVMVNTDNVAIIENPVSNESILGFTMTSGTVILFSDDCYLIVKETYDEVMQLMGVG